MSDYVSMRSITLKNEIMTPTVLSEYRSGNLSYKTMQDTSSPLQEIYKNTYQYLTFPTISPEAKSLLAPQSITQPMSNDDIALRVAKSIFPKN